MLNLPFRQTAISLFVLALSAGAISAQSSNSNELSADEILERFNQQTRGLVLAPSSSGATETTTGGASTTVAEISDVPKEQQVFVNISFDFDSAVLKEDQKPHLTNLCVAINSSDIKVFKIVGHTDSSGSEAYNDKLSLLRAEEVKRYMVNECGISDDRLLAVGVGERFPFNEDDPRSDENRRVEFQVVS